MGEDPERETQVGEDPRRWATGCLLRAARIDRTEGIPAKDGVGVMAQVVTWSDSMSPDELDTQARAAEGIAAQHDAVARKFRELSDLLAGLAHGKRELEGWQR